MRSKRACSGTNMGIYLFLSIFITMVFRSQCQQLTPEPPGPDDVFYARREWIKTDQDLKSAVSKISRRVMPVLMKEIYKKEVSGPCLGSLMAFMQALRQTKLWAYQMLDSSGRFPEGFLRGTLTSLGNYDECVSINVNETKVKLQGQYCTINLKPPMPLWKPFTSAHITVPELVNISTPDSLTAYLMSFIHNLHVTTIKVGICTPSKCSWEDVDKLVDIIPEQINLNWKFEVNHCETKNITHFTPAQFAALYIIGIVTFLVIVGTMVDLIWSSEEMENSSVKSIVFHVAKSFSFVSNAKKLSDFKAPESELSFLYGIIVFVFCANVMANTFMYVNYDVASNFTEALLLLQNLFYEVALNRVLSVQTLFFVNGFLAAYTCLKSPEKGFNVVRFLVKKLWRYTPAYALVICIILLTPTWGSGPAWTLQMNNAYENCRDNWWYNILYINNFIDGRQGCLDHTWVIAVAAQLHVIAILILVPLKHYPKMGLLLNLVIAVGSFACIALTNVYLDLLPNEMLAFLHPSDRFSYAHNSYYRVYSHLGIYCTGIFVAYFMVKKPDLKVSRRVSWCLWLTTGAGLLTALCIVHEWRKGVIPSPLMGAFYATFSKIVHCAFLAWVTVGFMTGHSGGFKDILGWRPFAFFARLTFIAYAMHVPIINMVMSFKKTHVFICELEIYYIVLSHVTGTYLVSYVLHMFFEAPWMSLADVLRKRTKLRTFTKEIIPERKDPNKTQGPMTDKPPKYSSNVCIEKGVH